jgi:hypothetical protein
MFDFSILDVRLFDARYSMFDFSTLRLPPFSTLHSPFSTKKNRRYISAPAIFLVCQPETLNLQPETSMVAQ